MIASNDSTEVKARRTKRWKVAGEAVVYALRLGSSAAMLYGAVKALWE